MDGIRRLAGLVTLLRGGHRRLRAVAAAPAFHRPHSVEKSTAIDSGDSVCKALAADQQKLVNDFKAEVPEATAEDAGTSWSTD